MKDLPKGLFATYDRILQNILEDDVEFDQKALSWLLVCDHPLRLREIVEALAMDVQSRRLDRDATLNDEQDLLEICSSLAAYNEDTGVISFSHFSVQVCHSHFLLLCIGSDLRISPGILPVVAHRFQSTFEIQDFRL
jgi:hypothetical protein